MNIRKSMLSLLLLAALVGPALADDAMTTPAATPAAPAATTPAAPAAAKTDKSAHKGMKKHKAHHHAKKVEAAK